MKVPFEHEFGRVTAVHRSDAVCRIDLDHDGNAPPPEYRVPRNEEALTVRIDTLIRQKSMKARGYDGSIPLWLAMRNPNQRMKRPPPELLQVAAVTATEVFDRVIIFNDPEGVMDPSPPLPLFVDLLPGSQNPSV